MGVVRMAVRYPTNACRPKKFHIGSFHVYYTTAVENGVHDRKFLTQHVDQNNLLFVSYMNIRLSLIDFVLEEFSAITFNHEMKEVK